MSIILQGKLVRLRSLSLRDAPRFCEWLRDGEVMKFFDHQQPPTLLEERQYIQAQLRKRDVFSRAIEVIDSGEHIGSCALNNIDTYARRAQLGIMIGNKKYWGQGCGTEATRLLIDYGFRKLNLHRVYLDVVAYNIRAIRLYKSMGFKVEGTRRQHVFHDDFWHDEIIMGLLSPDYLRVNKKPYGRTITKN